jgi:hypothetical protein
MKARLLALAAVALVAAPAHADANVTVSLALSAGTYVPTGAACALSVPAGADGIAVLDAAVAAHCITSYDTQTFVGIGTYVSCIDSVCARTLTGNAGTYWEMTENGAATAYGVDGFTAGAGDVLGFDYTGYAFV